jgi:hypothetical protein
MHFSTGALKSLKKLRCLNELIESSNLSNFPYRSEGQAAHCPINCIEPKRKYPQSAPNVRCQAQICSVWDDLEGRHGNRNLRLFWVVRRWSRGNSGCRIYFTIPWFESEWHDRSLKPPSSISEVERVFHGLFHWPCFSKSFVHETLRVRGYKPSFDLRGSLCSSDVINDNWTTITALVIRMQRNNICLNVRCCGIMHMISIFYAVWRWIWGDVQQ